MKARIVLALAMILIMVSSASVTADGATVPFRAYFVGPCNLVVCDAAYDCTYDISGGEGQATHLGTFDLVGLSVLSLGQGFPPYPYHSDQTFTAANGDQLFIVVDGAWDGTFVADFAITGGTGRVEGVTGGGAFWAWYDGTLGYAYFDGTLTKP